MSHNRFQRLWRRISYSVKHGFQQCSSYTKHGHIVTIRQASFSNDQYILNPSQLISHLLICDPCHTSHRQDYGTKGKTDQELVERACSTRRLLCYCRYFYVIILSFARRELYRYFLLFPLHTPVE